MKHAVVAGPSLFQEDARYLSAGQLAKLGVRRLNRYGILLQCTTCRAVWSPRLRDDGTLPPRYWQCPDRCNS